MEDGPILVATLIQMDDKILPAAICPICKVRCYPPGLALACFQRHEVLAAGIGLRICWRCHDRKPISQFTGKKRACQGCDAKMHTLTQRLHGSAMIGYNGSGRAWLEKLER